MLAKWRLITQQMIATVTYNQLITRGFAHTGGGISASLSDSYAIIHALITQNIESHRRRP